MKKLFLFFPFVISFSFSQISPPNFVPRFSGQSRLSVFPVLFVPGDASLSQQEAVTARELLRSHLAIAQEHYRSLLRTDTFVFLENDSNVYRSINNHSFFIDAPADNNDGKPNRIMKELFQWKKDDRYRSNFVYLVIYKRPEGKEPKDKDPWFGGGRPLNGPPNTGGGYVEMEFWSLMSDRPYPFQSTLVHELGHAFGMNHSDYLGYDLSKNMSIMSYNTSHWSKGLSQSSDPGGLNPEEYFVLSLNKRAFPDFVYNDSIHNPDGKSFDFEKIQQFFMGPMGESIGLFKNFVGVGYELYFDGRRVNGPDAALWSFSQAKKNLMWNLENQKGVVVEGRYNGVAIVVKE